jgi:integrase
MFRRQISEEITSTISIAWYFTTKSGGIWLFPGLDPARRLDRRNVYAVCREAGRKAQLPQVIHPHLLRHYADTRTMPMSIVGTTSTSIMRGVDSA